MSEKNWRDSAECEDDVAVLDRPTDEGPEMSERVIRDQTRLAERLVQEGLAKGPRTFQGLLRMLTTLSSQAVLYALTNLLARNAIKREERRLKLL